MRKGIIDIDWLDARINTLTICISRNKMSVVDSQIFKNELSSLKIVRSKCEPIEDVKTLSVIGKANEKCSGLLYGEPKELPTKCLLDWESAKYCHNDNKCLMCKTK